MSEKGRRSACGIGGCERATEVEESDAPPQTIAESEDLARSRNDRDDDTAQLRFFPAVPRCRSCSVMLDIHFASCTEETQTTDGSTTENRTWFRIIRGGYRAGA